MRERDVEKYLVQRIKALGGEVRKVQWVARRGAPDRGVFLPYGHTIWVELKAPGQYPTKLQAREHGRLRALGQEVYVLDSIEDVDLAFPGESD